MIGVTEAIGGKLLGETIDITLKYALTYLLKKITRHAPKVLLAVEATYTLSYPLNRKDMRILLDLISEAGLEIQEIKLLEMVEKIPELRTYLETIAKEWNSDAYIVVRNKEGLTWFTLARTVMFSELFKPFEEEVLNFIIETLTENGSSAPHDLHNEKEVSDEDAEKVIIIDYVFVPSDDNSARHTYEPVERIKEVLEKRKLLQYVSIKVKYFSKNVPFLSANIASVVKHPKL